MAPGLLPHSNFAVPIDHCLRLKMGCTLLELPTEVRLNLYSHLFDEQKILCDAGNDAGSGVMLPTRATPNRAPKSAQILRACKLIQEEAEPLLYQKLVVYVSNNTFAGSLPYRLSDGVAGAHKVKHIVWQLHCDLLKKFYFEDMVISSEDVVGLDSFEIHCQCEGWRDSIGKNVITTARFAQNRQQVVDYLKCLQTKAADIGVQFDLGEDQSFVRKGELRLRLSKQLRHSHYKVIPALSPP